MEKERKGLQAHVIQPLSRLMLAATFAAVLMAISGPLFWALGSIAFTALGIRYLKSAALIQTRCSTVKLPSTPLPQDFAFYPLFRVLRYGLLSAFTWWALTFPDRSEDEAQAEGEPV